MSSSRRVHGQRRHPSVSHLVVPSARQLPIPGSTARNQTLALGLTSRDFDELPPSRGLSIEYRSLFFTSKEPPQTVREWAEQRGVRLRALHEVADERGSRSRKVLFGLRDGYAIESVLIRRRDGKTACVSSQVGCAFSCQFCASGRAGLKRNLEAGEIVEQVVRLGTKVNRIVFMGIGEPLHNYDQVLAAIRILRDRRGMNFPTPGITLSTIGVPRGLQRLREEHLALNLTVSLHATTQEVRERLIPGSRRHDLAEVVGRALSWAERHQRVVTFVYLVLPEVNDTPADALRLAKMLAGKRARVNLMRWNPVDNVDLRRTPDRSLALFRQTLARVNIPVVVRDTQGRDSSAACGQLWLRDRNGAAVRRR